MERIIARMQLWPAAIRWLIWIPASLLTHVVVHVAVVLFGKFTTYFTRSMFGENFFVLLAAPAIAGYLAIRLPMMFAPSQRRGPALTLCVLWMAMMGLRSGVTAFTGDFPSSFAALVSAIGSAVGYFHHLAQMQEQERELERKLERETAELAHAGPILLPAPREQVDMSSRDRPPRD
jgi:hypothetical protein